MNEQKPFAAFVLSLVGFVLQILGAVFVTSFAFYFPGMWMMGYWHMGPWFVYPFWGLTLLTVAYLAVIIVLGAVGLFMLNATNVTRVRTGSILILIASVIALPTMFGLFFGSLLMLVGGILGLVWHPQV